MPEAWWKMFKAVSKINIDTLYIKYSILLLSRLSQERLLKNDYNTKNVVFSDIMVYCLFIANICVFRILYLVLYTVIYTCLK